VKRRGKNDCRWLSSEARAAKQLRRRLERRFRRTGNKSDKQAYDAAAAAAHASIVKSRTENFRGQLAEAQGDQRATWRVANRLLHSKPPAYHSDDDCARLSTTFGQFFKDKLNRISDTIVANLSSSSATAQHTAARTYSGPMFDGFRAVNVTNVQRLLIKMPAQLSPLDVVPTSLLKSCVDILAVVITRLANLSFHEGQFPSCFKTARLATTQEGWYGPG